MGASRVGVRRWIAASGLLAVGAVVFGTFGARVEEEPSEQATLMREAFEGLAEHNFQGAREPAEDMAKKQDWTEAATPGTGLKTSAMVRG